LTRDLSHARYRPIGVEPRLLKMEWLGRFILPKVVLIFVLTGFVGASIAGAIVTSANIFENFRRVNPYIGGETLFNITARELHGLLSEIPENKVIVIVGGTSRFNGVGQSLERLWTTKLQELLGNDYEVVNLALRAGRPDQFGNYAAEAMIAEGRKVIYVADIHVTERFQPAGTYPAYYYIFYDASARGLLLPSPERDAALATFESANPKAVSELKLRATANAFLNFDELWTYVGYEYAFLPGWSEMTIDAPFKARKLWPDGGIDGSFYDNYKMDAMMKYVEGFAAPLSLQAIDALQNSVSVLPEPLRKRTLMATIKLSPYYTDRMPPVQRASYEQNYISAAAAMARGGLRVVELGDDWTKDDYADGQHPSARGGEKAAIKLAPLVEGLSRDLGYLQP
jgi:hypothetical protein